MSPREKKLLLFFAFAGFAVLNFFGYSQYARYSLSTSADLDQARVDLDRAEMLRASSELVAGQMEWLAQHEPEPIAYQDVQSVLQAFVAQEASAAGLTIREPQRFLGLNDSGTHYHRARFQINVTGQEQALYAWLHKIKSPEEFRAVTRILMKPNGEDDTLIDCTAEIEQWFIPADPGA